MGTQPLSAVASRTRTVPAEPQHEHGTACYWDVDDCRWQCATYPLVHYALEHCTTFTRPVPGPGRATRP